MATDIGLVRQSNQDAIYADDELAIVADGMGGHAAGDVAASIAIERVREEFTRRPTIEGLFNAIDTANQTVLGEAGANPDLFGMGTTVIAVGLTRGDDGRATPTMVHVGDSRAYQLRDGALRQLSEDHSVAEEWVKMGRLTPQEAAIHPRRHQLTRGVGVESTIAVDVMTLDVLPGDRVLLCSDGLSNELSNEQLAQLASEPTSLDDAVESLVAAARASGGHDNISVVLLEFDEVTPTTTPVRRTMTTPPPTAARQPIAPPRRRRGHGWWRAMFSVIVLAGIGWGFVAIMHWYAYSSYYLADHDGYIAVYQGQEGGVLWYHPRRLLDTNIALRQLSAANANAVRRTISEPTLTAALHYANYLHSQWQMSQATTTTTITSSSGTTTTVAPAQG